MQLNLKGKVAMVAASSKGLGFGIAQELAREGAKLSIASRSKDGIEAAANKLREEAHADVLTALCLAQLSARGVHAPATLWRQQRRQLNRQQRSHLRLRCWLSPPPPPEPVQALAVACGEDKFAIAVWPRGLAIRFAKFITPWTGASACGGLFD